MKSKAICSDIHLHLQFTSASGSKPRQIKNPRQAEGFEKKLIESRGLENNNRTSKDRHSTCVDDFSS